MKMTLLSSEFVDRSSSIGRRPLRQRPSLLFLVICCYLCIAPGVSFFPLDRHPTKAVSTRKATSSSSTSLRYRNSGSHTITSSYKNEELEPEVERRLKRWLEEEEEEEEVKPPVALRDPPTQAKTKLSGKKTQSPKPTIVVLGASGRIGRLVVQQLMGMSQLDAKVVAFVRDPIKASHVLYGEHIMAKANRFSNVGPQLQVVVGDLFPELDNFDEEASWRRRAESAARFFNGTVEDYDDGALAPPALEEALQDLMKESTVIVNCIGAVRLTNVWEDVLKAPWRLFRHDVSKFCTDTKHPYYSQYLTTLKVLRIAEKEQIRREAEREEEEAQEKEGQDLPISLNSGETEYMRLEKKMETPQQRLRFIGISDLVVSRKPWMMLPIVTNLINSMVLRYQEKAEKLMIESPVLDTIVLRPGQLIDEERDEDITHLEVSPTGKVPFPAVVSRQDVASLAVASALIKSARGPSFKDMVTLDPWSGAANKTQAEPFHMTLACRWVGDCEQFGTHGLKADGKEDASKCMDQVLSKSRGLARLKRRQQHRNKRHVAALDSLAYYAKRFDQERRLKSYTVFVALPVYLFLGLFMARLIHHARILPFMNNEMAPFLVRKWTQLVAFATVNGAAWMRWLQRATKKVT